MIFNRLFLISFSVGFILLLSSCSGREDNESFEDISFNKEWQFALLPAGDIPEDFSWKEVIIPHTPRIEALVMKDQQWQGTCTYRKIFDSPDPAGNKYVALRFGAAMHKAKVYCNGELITTHKGGYLPFIADLSGKLKPEDNVLLLELNNENNEHIPPGKEISGLDFNYYGGLYRKVDLIVKDLIHITDPVNSANTGGGGVYITHELNNEGNRELSIKVEIANLYASDKEVSLDYKLYNSEKMVTSHTLSPLTIKHKETKELNEKIELLNPLMWSPENPALYRLDIIVRSGARVYDKKSLKIGIRDINFTSDGFLLNGEYYKIRGTNRHQEYPYLGYAIGENADYRDAYKIKKSGFNFVRLSHYPHSDSFLDACDELGLLVMDAIPGWQFMGDSVFQENSKNDLRDMIRRDRNHPSVILWEASLNESWMPYDFISEMHRITKEELPGRDSYTCGWMDTIYDVFIPARQHAKAPAYWNTYSKPRALLIAEYGDWEYYAQNAGFNQAAFEGLMPEERTSRQLRGDGQKRLAQQALNYQEAHNDNLKGSHAGDANWLMFDYNRGYAPDIESSGIMDIFRIPKFSAWFYRSQKDLCSGDTVLFIANYWDDPGFTDVKIFSNCDRVDLWLNDSLIASKEPDRDVYSTELEHPPFTFVNLAFVPGKLEARGIVDGKTVISTTRITPGKAEAIGLDVDYSGKKVDGTIQDVVFVYASVKDNKGNVLNKADDIILFSLEGDGELIGDNPARAEAGIATLLFRTKGNSRSATISAESEELGKAKINIAFK